MREDNALSYFLTDHLGSIVAVTDSTGVLTSETRYDPFGETRTDVGSITETDYGFTYQQNITGTGLVDYNARMYDPSLGRFTQPDSLVPDPTSSIGFNRYAYVNNNPINFTDPSGHRLCDDGDADGNCDNNGGNGGGGGGNGEVVDEGGGGNGGDEEEDTYLENVGGAHLKRNGTFDYYEASYDNSGNQELNNVVGITPTQTGTILDFVILGIDAIDYIDSNSNFIENIFQVEPDVYAVAYYKPYVNGIEIGSEHGIDLVKIEIINNTFESISKIQMDFSSTQISMPNVTFYEQKAIYTGELPPGTSATFTFAKSIRIPDPWCMNIKYSFRTRNFYGITENNIP